MLRQYHAMKQQHPGAILLFRMGDFYEMFYEDAQEASRLLDITLTARGKGTDNVAPMCGFPHHQLEPYTARLVSAGRRVAVCEQMEDPRQAKGLVKRSVVRVVTPGTLTDPQQLEAKENRWIAAVAAHGETLGAAFLDASTGEFVAWQSPPEGEPWEALASRFDALTPHEVVHAEGFAWDQRFRERRLGRVLLTEQEPYGFAPRPAAELLERHFRVASLDGFGLRDRPAATAAAGGLLLYVQETQKSGLEHIDRLSLHEPSETVLLDPATRRNLELERSIRDGGRQGSLVQAIDETVTPSGGRLLRRWLLGPLRDPAHIEARLDAVEELLAHPELRRQARERLGGVHDIERLLARAVGGTANARDLLALRGSLERLPGLVEALAGLRAALARGILDGLDPCDDLAGLLARGIADDPPAGLREGGVIRDGFNAELDELRAISRDGKSYIASLEAKERQATGIQSLKVRYNKVFGYFIEVSKANLHLAPEHYHRKQTISTGERFVTPELKEYESKVLGAQERIESLEYELFGELRRETAAQATRLKAAARAAAEIDVLAGLAECASLHDYRRPTVGRGTRLRVSGGRHPVVEQSLTERRFVPNDTSLDAAGEAIAILTGPNMGGKSTYLRQVALIVLLAQAGSFVPAEQAEIGVVEQLHARRPTPPRTLFATHYHELTELAVELPAVLNCRMAVRERGDDVVFLHRVEPGAADRSYGIQVARLAGVPAAVVARAKEILGNLERDEYGRDGLPRRARRHGAGPPGAEQPTLFPGLTGPAPAAPREDDDEPADPTAGEVLAELRSQDPDRMTPLQALERLAEWKRRLDG